MALFRRRDGPAIVADDVVFVDARPFTATDDDCNAALRARFEDDVLPAA